MIDFSHHLAFHGAIVLTFGLLLGAPYARAIRHHAPEQTVHAWRVAHASLPMGACLMFAVAALLALIPLARPVAAWVTGLLIVSAYAFCISTTLAALTGDRGLSAGAKGCKRAVYLGNLVGATTSLAASVTLVLALAWVLLQGPVA